MSRLLVVQDGKREREVQLAERLVVGRDPTCDITFEDGMMSRRHAEFITTRESVTVRDIGSRNGVFVNGTRVTEKTLNLGDLVQIGSLRIRYIDRPPALMSGFVVSDPPAPERTASDAETGSLVTPIRAQAIDDDADSGALVDEAAPHRFEDEVDVTSLRQAPAVATSPPVSAPDDPATPRLPPPPSATAPTPAPPAASGAGAVAPADDWRPLTTFVFAQIAVLTAVVFLSTLLSPLLWRTSGSDNQNAALAVLIRVGIPGLVSLVAASLIGTLLNRRFQDVLNRARHDPAGRS